ncbi:AMP-binding protein [Solemya velesiana gill symbiont]|uniref:AMP-binding protein n=1 Tax=Solemya velesiana gill symbiont TaxID=1918948 RepID=UPI001FEBA184|nr:AMP-binding protein [Solemya velesiana gill symbiont]
MSMPSKHNSYFQREGDEPLLEVTIPQWFARIVETHGDCEAVVSRPQSRRLTYRQLSEEVDCLARGLMGLGFAKGDRIGIWSTNNIEWLLLQMATARIGVVLVNINPAYRSQELAYVLQRSEVQGLFLIPVFRSSNYVGMMQKLLPSLVDEPTGELQSNDFPDLRRVVVYDPQSPLNTNRPAPDFLLGLM